MENMPNFKVSIDTGDKKVISSGIAYCFDKGDTIKLKIECSEHSTNPFVFCLIFSFTNEEGKEPYLKIETNTEKNEIHFNCINFNDSLGRFIINPYEVAKFNNKKIYIRFGIFSPLNNSLKKLEYSLYYE